MSQALAAVVKGQSNEDLARLAFNEQRAADAAQRKARSHQSTADAARKELKRRKSA